jgi:membrane peptidoglycan carboxypeptidase
MTDFKIRLHSSNFTGFPGNLSLKNIRAACNRRPCLKRIAWILGPFLIVFFLIYEIRTSALQSWILSSYARKMFYKVEPGPSSSIVFPKHGPFDVRTGYALIPDFRNRLSAAGYRITKQVRFSPELERAANWGFLPPYSEPTATRLVIQGMDGQPLFQAPVIGDYFNSFEEIPDLAVKSLLLIENRELVEPSDNRTNPVVDWNRLAKAAILYAGHKLGLPLPVEGGSTLATQMEKYRHSYDGRTNSILSKLRQMTDASLRVYQHGPDTREERRQIVLDYLNSIPLAGAPGYGEIHGIGNGLQAWFGLDLKDVRKSFALPDGDPKKARAFKNTLALLCAVKAPSNYLVQNHSALLKRVNFYTQLFAKLQIIPADFANQVISQPLLFSVHPPEKHLIRYAERKAINEIRSKLVNLLGVPSLYELDRLHLNIQSSIHPALQHRVITLFEDLKQPEFVNQAGLVGKHLLETGDPAKVIYGMMLFEKTAQSNMLRVVTDNLNAPFDINTGMKMQLGSTAKLRTLSNYLDIVATLHEQLSSVDAGQLQQQAKTARDPITGWAAETLAKNKINLDAFLQMALDRKYSASPGEAFFTGAGIHNFQNFDKADNGRILTVREATMRSVNLVYIRLMRDLVRYYQARLPYNTDEILANPDNPTRHRMLQGIADEESKHFLYQAFMYFSKQPPEKIVETLLGKSFKSDRHLAILFYAWHHNADEQALTKWLNKYLGTVTPEQTERMVKAYSNPRLNLSDYGYLLGMHPLKVWCAGEMVRQSALDWDQLWGESAEARQTASAWLFKTRNRAAQDLRLRIRFEQDAFIRMTPHWKRLAFPFDRLVPSLATAIGSSGDRPEALAQLMGILVNNGVRQQTTRMCELHFAAGTPYETVMSPAESKGVRVMPEAVARAILPVLASVVQNGTAARLAGALKSGDKPLIVGGKTGSGDNRTDSYGRGGQLLASNPTDRTAVFVFYIEDRFFGVVTAFVPGKEAGSYVFTSSLPVAILKLLAPDINALWLQPSKTSPKGMTLASNPTVSINPDTDKIRPAAIQQQSKQVPMQAIPSAATPFGAEDAKPKEPPPPPVEGD